MLRFTVLHLAALCLALASSCGSTSPFIQARSVEEAELLRAEVARKNIQGNDIALADAHLATAKEGKKNAMYYADLAAAYYRTALADQSLEASRKSLGDAEAALAVSVEQVRKYETILAEVSAGKGQ